MADVTSGYRGIPAIRGVGLEVLPGEIVAILGANGAGKSTTLLTLAGVLTPLSGVVEALGQPVVGGRPHLVARRGLCLVPDSRALLHGLTVRENLAVALSRSTARIAADNAARGLSLLRPNPGETIVVTGASGALGGAAVQFARLQGLTVIGISGRSSLEYVESLGATAVEHGDDLADRVRAVAPGPIDAALDTAGKGLVSTLLDLRGGTGRVVTLADPAAAAQGVTFSAGHPGNRDSRPVREALEHIAAGRWRTRIARTFPLHRAAEAHRTLEAGHTGGKLLLVP
ncbi:zinc-binding dehydrogenase [Pseudonocardia sp. EV170527-09]|nr:zinc-binding dehydrogenase [Pseudonocardia sp. EV170527-09]